MSSQRTQTEEIKPLEEQRDIYDVLGITPNAPALLARQLYWVKLEDLRDAADREAPGAVRAIEELNEALSIVQDPHRRADYDSCSDPGRTSVHHERTRRHHAGLIFASVIIASLVVLAAARYAAPLVAAGTAAAGMLAVIAIVTLIRRATTARRGYPLAILGLSEDATLREVQLAYETLAQELLAYAKFDRNTISKLERLDWAYLQAWLVLSPRESKPQRLPGRLIGRLLYRASRLLGTALLAMIGALGTAALFTLRALGRLVYRAASPGTEALRARSARGFRRTAERLLSISLRMDGDERVPASIPIDVEQRLAFGLRAAAPRPAVVDEGIDTETAVSPPRPEVLVNACLVLESAAGARRVPIQTAPLRIGHGPECDVVLPADLGIAAEHALVWQRDGSLVMHVVDPRGGMSLVNGIEMTWAALDDGDLVTLGQVSMRVEIQV